MKKIFVILIAVLIPVTAIFAQRVEIQNASNYSRNNDLTRAIESAEKATKDPETSKDSKAWYLKGTILLKLDDMYSIYNAAKTGLTQTEYNKELAPFNAEEPNAPLKPNSSKKIKLDDGSRITQATYQYDVIVKFDANGKLFEASEPTNGRFLKEYNNDLLDVAFDAFQKAIEYNNDEESVTNAKINLSVISQRYFNQAVNQYQNKNYMDASSNFEKSFLMKKNFFNQFDSVSYEYANNAIKMYMQESLANNDTATYMATCAMGAQKFPDDVFYVISEANIWLAKNEPEKVIQSLEKAMTMVTDNATIFYAIGVNYGALHNVDKSVEAYKKAIEIDPKFFDAYYNLAAIYVNTGNEFLKEANNLPISENEKYEELKKKSEDYYQLAIPYLEKAHELDKTDINVLNTLREIYVKIQRLDDAKKIKELIDELKAAE
ncbi:MAG: tetratricopeptide repeat protein [Bacteroidales bacterium]|jgi:tetratricopeptide (TPR) repeat protein|nr:tetratricopeptide repeat protein [Bacteroidales bacterium]